MKLGLVVEGGGMKCAWSAAILDRLMDDEIRPDYAIGASAGAACAASFVAGQRGRNRRFFVDHVSEPRYMGASALLREGSFFNLHYIYQELTGEGGADELDYEAILRNPCELWAVATDVETGKPAYFTKKDMHPDDFRVFMATCAIPVVCRPVEIGGRLYCDGGCSDPIPVRRAFEAGCDRVIVVLCRPADTVRTPEAHRGIYHAVLKRSPQLIRDLDTRHLRYNARLAACRRLEEEGRVLILAPRRPLAVSTYTKDAKVLQGMYDLGLHEYERERGRVLAFAQDRTA